MTHLERLGSKRVRPACPVAVLGGATLGELTRRALEQLRLENPLDITEPDPSTPVPGKPCLILLDLSGNPLKGLSVLRAHPARPGVPVIALGPEGQPGIVAQTYALGAQSYLVRPPTDADTLELLKLALDYWLRISRIPE